MPVPTTVLAVDLPDAVRASGDHPLVAHLSAYPAASLGAWRYGDAVAVGYHYWSDETISAVGPAADVAALATGLGDTVPAWISLPAEAADLLPAGFLLDTHGWAFRWTDAPTGTDRDAAGWLGDGDGDEDDLAELLATAFPHASVRVGSPRARRWAGVRDDRGRLVACAADATGHAGTGFVASITTLPGLRGKGFGGRVTGWLVDRLVAEHGRAALWVEGDNAPATAVYDRLGMRELRMTAGALPAAHDLVDADEPQVAE